MQTKNTGLNANQLKLIAIFAMTVDHLTWAFFPGCQRVWYVFALHVIGRLTAPIMWFFIAEGAFYTRDIKKYILRLLGFAVISHFAYCFAFGIPVFGLSAGAFNRTSVLWSLALAAVVIAVCRGDEYPPWVQWGTLLLACVLSFPSDWSSVAVMAPFYIYQYRGDFKKQALAIVGWSFVYAAVYFLFLDRLYGALQLFTCLSLPLLRCYNGQRGKWKGMKWLFYVYYPAHLVLVGLVRLLVQGDISIIF